MKDLLRYRKQNIGGGGGVNERQDKTRRVTGRKPVVPSPSSVANVPFPRHHVHTLPHPFETPTSVRAPLSFPLLTPRPLLVVIEIIQPKGAMTSWRSTSRIPSIALRICS